MSKPSEPEVISRRKLFLLAGLAASFAVAASVITASNADAQQPEAQQPSEPPKEEKEEEGGADERGTSAQPIGSTEGTVDTRRQPDRSCLLGLIPARAPLRAAMVRGRKETGPPERIAARLHREKPSNRWSFSGRRLLC